MTGVTLKVVTVEVEGLSLGATVAMFHLFEKLARQHGFCDLIEAECSIEMSARNLLEFQTADAAGLKQALDDLQIDAFVSEATL